MATNDMCYVLVSRTPCYDCLGKRLVGEDEVDARLFPTFEKAHEAMVWVADELANEWGEPTVYDYSTCFPDGADGPELLIIATRLEC